MESGREEGAGVGKTKEEHRVIHRGFSLLASRSEIATLAPQRGDEVAALPELLCLVSGHGQGELSLPASSGSF